MHITSVYLQIIGSTQYLGSLPSVHVQFLQQEFSGKREELDMGSERWGVIRNRVDLQDKDIHRTGQRASQGAVLFMLYEVSPTRELEQPVDPI